MDHEPRPCHKLGKMPNECAAAHFRRVIDNHMPLHGPWAGWRMAGRDLVSPEGDRINARRLSGILWAERTRVALAKQRRAPKVAFLTLPAREPFVGSA